MGYAVAEELAQRGARVTLISGRTSLECPKGVERVDVLSAEDMYNACCERFDASDGAVMCAAVADYTPATVADQKLKKGDGDMSIALKRTHDIAATLGQRKRADQRLVGFALETHDEMHNAQRKLQSKNLDMIVLNSLQDTGAGFGTDTNKVTFLYPNGTIKNLPLMPKEEVADEIISHL
jgi:phosphopantothenoylcysteine decarboxylase/phosphopantothenate--cysteine ligase